MPDALSLHIIGHIRSDFPDKFGIPRQAGLVPELKSRLVFAPEYRNRDALRGIEGFSHLWLIWVFDRAIRESWSPTVRPPRLGGNERLGVFATRSPFRPNPVGLSAVRLLGVEETAEGPTLLLGGADLADGTAVLDVKPYIPYADSIPDAVGGFASVRPAESLDVVCDEALLARVPEEKREALLAVLRQDPRPRYQKDPERVYGLTFAGRNIRFTVAGGILTVRDIVSCEERGDMV